MKGVKVQWLFALAWIVMLTALLNIGTGLWALKRLEKKAGTPIHGVFVPHLFQPSFTLKNASLTWQNRFKVVSGTFLVRYHPLPVLVGRSFRVQVSGSGLGVRILENSALSGVHPSEIKVERFNADFTVSPRKTPEIFSLNVQSPELEFNFAEKGRNPVKQAGSLTEN